MRNRRSKIAKTNEKLEDEEEENLVLQFYRIGEAERRGISRFFLSV